MKLDAVVSFLNDVDRVVAAGGRTSREFDRIRARWEEFNGKKTSALDRAAEAVVGDGPTDRFDELRAQALAELAGPVQLASVTNHVVGVVGPRLRLEYGKTAASNHATAAERFNAAAAQLDAAAGLVALEASAESVMYATDEVRLAWGDVPKIAHTLDELGTLVATAAILAGAAPLATEEGRLALVVDPAEAKRRAVWEAWEDRAGRAGRWGRLLAVGAKVYARPLDEVQAYRKPAPMEVRHVKTGIGWGSFLVDPEEENEVTLAPGRG